jgi:hypothetical protein
MATASVSAQPPIPDYYSIVVDGPCWLPDGEAHPAVVQSQTSSFYWTKPLTLVVSCSGWLPKGAPRPKEPIKLTYETTGRYCEATLKNTTYTTLEYGAVVYPKGLSTITCRIGFYPDQP